MGIEMIRIMNLTPLPFASPLLAPTTLSGHHKGGRIEDGALFKLFFLLPQILAAVWELPKWTCCLWCSCSLQRGRDFHSYPSLSEFDDPNYNCSIINIITIAIVTVNVDITGIVIIIL